MLAIYLSMLETQEEKDRFEELYLKYRSSMYKRAYSILNNNEDAEDAVHEAFLCIANKFKKIGSLTAPKMKSYIVIMIRNISLNIYNGNKKRSEHNIDMDSKDISFDVNYFENIDIAMVIIMTMTTVMSVGAFREAFIGFFVNTFSDHSNLKCVDYDQHPDTIEDIYEIGYDLSGYYVDFKVDYPFEHTLKYKNKDINIC